MNEKKGICESELQIHPSVIEALTGTISEPIQTVSQKPNTKGQLVEVCLVREGAGLFGLKDLRDNEEWAGITNHVLLSTRYSVHFAQKMAEKGYKTNPQRILDGMIVSHAGRRVWDEAGWYPEAVDNVQAKRSISNEMLGIELIQGKVSQGAFELVVALAHGAQDFHIDPSIYNSLDYKIAIYTDHRTSQKFEPLNKRMGDFLIGNFYTGKSVSQEQKDNIYKAMKELIDRRKSEGLTLTLEEADQIAQDLGANGDSNRLTRKELMRLILQDADTEKELETAGIDVNNINDEAVPMPDWEDKFRQQYVEAAKDRIIPRIVTFKESIRINNLIGNDNDAIRIQEIFDEEFPPDTWWGQYARKLWL